MIKTKINKKYITSDNNNNPNGYLVPIYNVNEGFFEIGKEPQQVYLTVITRDKIKGPHLHYIRTGCFTCIKGDARFVLKTENGYEVFYSGENYEYKTIIVPTGIPAALQNIGNDDAFVLNMPNPAWTPDMNDEYSADFKDFDFSSIDK
jgi:hypothetical protein